MNVDSEIKLKKPATKIFRVMIGSIITDNEIWAQGNADKILEDYSDLTQACAGMFLKKKLFLM
jgi:hypothetical protein